MFPAIQQRSAWRFVAIQMLAQCTNESAWRDSRMSTELLASPWTPKAEILERFSPTPKQSRIFSLKQRIRSSQLFIYFHIVFKNKRLLHIRPMSDR